LKNFLKATKYLTIVLTLVFFSENVVFAYFSQSVVWSERRREIDQFPMLPALVDPHALIPGLRAEESTVLGADAGPRVIQIRDVHLNQEAQRNIALAITDLSRQKAIDMIALEGASGPIVLEAYRRFRRPDLIRALAVYLLNQGRISGPVFAALTMPVDAPPIVGVDDPILYRANVQAYRRSMRVAPACKARLVALKKDFERTEKKSDNSALWKFHALASGYHAGSVPLSDYLGALREQEAPLSSNVRRFLDAFALERTVDFAQAERQRSDLLNRLLRRIDAAESKQLFYVASQLGAGQAPADVFYTYVLRLCERHGIAVAPYGMLRRYVRYLESVKKMKVIDVLSDLDAAERALYDRYARTAFERQWVERSQTLELSRKLVEFSLTAREWHEYAARTPLLDLSSFENFYRTAERRDAALSSNLLREMRARGASRAVLVSGGFHSAGITQALSNAHVGTALYSPRVSRVATRNGTAYLNAFLQEHTPLERLFRGEKLFLAYPPAAGVAELAGALPALSGDPTAYEAVTKKRRFRVDVAHPSPNRYSADYSEANGAVRVSVDCHEGVVHKIWSQVLRRSAGTAILSGIVDGGLPGLISEGARNTILASSNAIAALLRQHWEVFLCGFLGLIVVCLLSTIGRSLSRHADRIAARIYVFVRDWYQIHWLLRMLDEENPAVYGKTFLKGERIAKRITGDGAPMSSLAPYIEHPSDSPTSREEEFWERLHKNEEFQNELRKTLTGNELEDALKRNALSVFVPLRASDGATSAQDMESVRTEIEPVGRRAHPAFYERGGIVTITSELGLTITFKPLADKQLIEFQRGTDPVRQIRKTAAQNKASRDLIPYIVNNIFGIRGGVRIEVMSDSFISDWGGVESSSVFYGGLIAAMSTLLQSKLSLADFYHVGKKIENEFGVITGNQGMISALRGGVTHTIFIDTEGQFRVPFSMPLLDPEKKTDLDIIHKIEEHSMLVQAGLEYETHYDDAGNEYLEKKIDRSSTLINQMWRDLQDNQIDLPLLHETFNLGQRYRLALKTGNMPLVCQTKIRLVEIRDALCRRCMEFLFSGDPQIVAKAPRGRRARRRNELAQELWDRVFVNPPVGPHDDYDVIRVLLRKLGKEQLIKTSLYSYGAQDLIALAKTEGIAVMPTGGGGPNSTLEMNSPKGKEHLIRFCARPDVNLKLYDRDEILADMKSGRPIRRYLPLKIGFKTLTFSDGFKQLGLELPYELTDGKYMQHSGEWVPGPKLPSNQVVVKSGSKQTSPVFQEEVVTIADEDLKETAELFSRLVRKGLHSSEPVTLAWLQSVLDKPADDGDGLEQLLNGVKPGNRPLTLSDYAGHPDFLKYVQESLAEKPEHVATAATPTLTSIVQGLEILQRSRIPISTRDLRNSKQFVIPMGALLQKGLISDFMRKISISPNRPILVLAPASRVAEYRQLYKSVINRKLLRIIAVERPLFEGRTFLPRNLEVAHFGEFKANLPNMVVVLKEGVVIDPSISALSPEAGALSFLFFNGKSIVRALTSWKNTLQLRNFERALQST
jgi:hypothetical protein